MTRALLLAAVVAAIWAAAVAAAGGFDFHVAGLSIRSHSATPAIVVAVVCVILLVARGPAAAIREVSSIAAAANNRAAWIAVALAVVAIGFGAAFGTYVAGGPDSYCYLNQAELLARGAVIDEEPLGARAPWPDRKWSFVPTGHVPAPAGDGRFVPMCAPGYPLLMALPRAIAGRTAAFWIVPLMGGLAVWLTFVLGRRVCGPSAGLFAAAVLATSPTFLYQVVQPMTDVPAVALWTLALTRSLVGRNFSSADVGRNFSSAGAGRTEVRPYVLRPAGRTEVRPYVLPAGRTEVRACVLSGAATGAALMVRPNLLPLAVVTGFIAAGVSFRRLVLFGVGALPFVAAIAWFNATMYGGPLKSGYGDLSALFSASHVLPNLARYPVWLARTTPFALLALAAPLMPGLKSRPTYALLAFAAAAFACYLPYEVFDAWWYLRFVLPAFPPLIVLASAAFIVLVAPLPPAVRTTAVAAALAGVAALHLYAAETGDVFRLRDFERRFRDGGEYVARQLPQNAAIVTFMQSGSVRYYSGRPTLVWTAVDPDWLDRALDFLRAQGLRPYLLFEGDEDQQFRQKFEGHSRIGALEWPPMADIHRKVWIYDPEDYERFRRGEPVRTDLVRNR
jgi:oligosaccharyl transferase STT3 subunit